VLTQPTAHPRNSAVMASVFRSRFPMAVSVFRPPATGRLTASTCWALQVRAKAQVAQSWWAAPLEASWKGPEGGPSWAAEGAFLCGEAVVARGRGLVDQALSFSFGIQKDSGGHSRFVSW
jgi:hypothetical protein